MNELSLLPSMSEKSDLILSQLMKAKAEMGNVVKKDATNPFHKSTYATLGAHLELSEAVLFHHGLLMLHTPNIINNQHVLIATLHHPVSGQWIKSYLPLPNPKNDSQGIGASITYMRRYSINCMLALNAEDDDAETASGRGKYAKQNQKDENEDQSKSQDKLSANSSQTKGSEKVGKEEISSINKLLQNLDQEGIKNFSSWIKKQFDAQNLTEIPRSGFEMCMGSINAKIKYINDKNKQTQQLAVA